MEWGLGAEELVKKTLLIYSPVTNKAVESAVDAIKEVINGIPEELEITADLAPGFVRGVDVKKLIFRFGKPKAVEVCGSYLTRSLIKADATVDLMVRLPKSCFVKGDHMDYLYHTKRCLYLCAIKKHLLHSPSVKKVEWSSFQNECRKPVLIIYPAGIFFENSCCKVRLIPTAKSIFKPSKLKLHRDNLNSISIPESTCTGSTPYYNNSILEDVFLEENANFISKTFSGLKELTNALILIKIWARQRYSIYTHDCVNGFLISAILAFLTTEVGSYQINRHMKSKQIFRVVMTFIATSKSWGNSFYFQLPGKKSISEEERILNRKLFPVVLCDPFSHFNLMFRMSSNGFEELQEEATLALNCLDNYPDDCFEKLFLTKVDIPAKYDYCMRLNLKGNSNFFGLGHCVDKECWRLGEEKILNVLKKGLNDRAKFCRVIWKNVPAGLNIEHFAACDAEPVLVGISISALDKALRLVDVGPSAEDKEQALEFREFWGDKAELRRFKDGKISESTVWEVRQCEKHLIIKKISEYVLSRHLAVPSGNIVFVADQLDFSLHQGYEDPVSFSGSLMKAFDFLCERLRLLDDIPLRVCSVQPLDSAFRSASVFIPEPHPFFKKNANVGSWHKSASTCLDPLEVVIQLEGSGSWPMNGTVIEKTKFAFLLKIGESLQRQGMTCVASEDNVDIIVSGYAFRLRILHERAPRPLKQGRAEASPADRQLYYGRQHSGMINGLMGRFPALAPVVRLAKRWTASHLFSGCLADEAIELLTAHIFLQPLPFHRPSSRVSGFLRFLRLLSEYKWESRALVVDINDDLSPTDKESIDEKFMQSRKEQGGGDERQRSMFLATAYDRGSDAWTPSSPTPSELAKVAAYARSSASLLSNLISLHVDGRNGHRWECLFRTPLDKFDAVILLHRQLLPFQRRILFPFRLTAGKLVASGRPTAEFSPTISAPGSRNGEPVMVDFNPLKRYIDDVISGFPEFKIWYDSLGTSDFFGLTLTSDDGKKRLRRDPFPVLGPVADAGKGLVNAVYLN